MVTPMCQQLTYEGLIDEVYSIQNSACVRTRGLQPRPRETDTRCCLSVAGSRLPAHVAAFVDLEPAITGFKEKRKVPLTSADTLYASVRTRWAVTQGRLCMADDGCAEATCVALPARGAAVAARPQLFDGRAAALPVGQTHQCGIRSALTPATYAPP